MKGRGHWAAAVLGAVALLAVVWPGVLVVGQVVRGLVGGGPGVPVRLSAAALADTAAVAALIAGLATAIALPVAWAARRVPARVFLLCMVPMLMPSYLAYAGWGLLKAPGTWLGDYLMRGPPGVGAEGNWYPVFATKSFALGGLVLWSWPLAALVVGATFRRMDQSVLDTLRLEAGWWRRGWAILGMARGAIAAAVGLVGLVMVGSAVPLHVAQFETYAVQIWRSLDEVGAAERWRVWWGAWPLVLVAVGAGVMVGGKIEGGEGMEEQRAMREGARGAWAAWIGGGVWVVSVLAPMGLMVWNLRGWGMMVRFWRLSRASFWWSVWIALAVGAVSLVLVAAVWIESSAPRSKGPRRRITRDTPERPLNVERTTPRGAWGGSRTMRLACTALLIAGLMPGVLVGSAIARAWGLPGLRWIGDSAWVVVIGHVARYGFVAVLAGWWLARGEPRELRDMRDMDAGGSVRGWAEAALPPQLGALLGAAVACGLLSFHEIEATVMLQPPTSMGGGFAWKVLQALHFSREEDLVPAMLIVMGMGLAAALAVVGLLGLSPRLRRGASQ